MVFASPKLEVRTPSLFNISVLVPLEKEPQGEWVLVFNTVLNPLMGCNINVVDFELNFFQTGGE